MIVPKYTIAIILIIVGINAKQRDPRWAKKLNNVLMVRDSYIGKLENLKQETTAQNTENFIAAVENVSSQLTEIDNLDVQSIEKNRELLKKLINHPEEPTVTKFFRSKKLESNYAERGLGFILKTLRAHFDDQCIKILLSSPQTGPTERPIPIDAMCSRVKTDVERPKKYIFSTDKICRNVNQCSGSNTPHPYGDSDGTSAQDACTTDNNATWPKHCR